MLPSLANYNDITSYVKRNIEVFLTEMEDFYPFGVAILKNGELQPFAAHLDEDKASKETLLPIFENHLQEKTRDGEYQLGAVAIAVLIKENGLPFDAVQIRFYSRENDIQYVNY